MRSLGRFETKFFNTVFAIVNRLTRLFGATSKSSDSMLPERSIATTMSTPLAVIFVSLRLKRGCASATMRQASPSQRSAARNCPARERDPLLRPVTSCVEE